MNNNNQTTPCQARKFNLKKTLIAATVSAALLSGCGGGGGTDDYSPPDLSNSNSGAQSLQGSSVKGPMINATVKVYAFDTSTGRKTGEALATGTTDEQARFSNVVIPEGSGDEEFFNQYFLVETSGGTVTTTEEAPSIETLSTLITGREYSKDSPVYATPLSSLAVALIPNILENDPEASFGQAYVKATALTASGFGFGLVDANKIFDEAPLIVDSGNSQSALEYRTASEAFTAILLLLEDSSGSTPDQLLELIARDLADEAVDGLSFGSSLEAEGMPSIEQLKSAISTQPERLKIPNTDRYISELTDILVSEAAELAPGISFDKDIATPDATPALGGLEDSDGDYVSDALDTFPNNPKEWLDSDGDCNLRDNDAIEGNFCGDESDHAPYDPNVTYICDPGALDGNGVPIIDNQEEYSKHCADDDFDTVPNSRDLFPLNPSEYKDSDGDCPAEQVEPSNQKASSGNLCGDNADRNICYSMQAEGRVMAEGLDNVATAHGLGYASFDSYKQTLNIRGFHRAFVFLDPSALVTYYGVDCSDSNDPNCVDVAPDVTIAAADVTLETEYYVNFENLDRTADLSDEDDRTKGQAMNFRNCQELRDINDPTLFPNPGNSAICMLKDEQGIVIPNSGQLKPGAIEGYGDGFWAAPDISNDDRASDDSSFSFRTQLTIVVPVTLDYRATRIATAAPGESCPMTIDTAMQEEVIELEQTTPF
ncbi:hypothetical protein EDC56_1197 [Sinobacterium caligoides]|uniref:Thrombospondin type 3 repeat-containing protein n=1 Tax=Sinobacterium caligoides TaxID=933926 RepID=A0A3N2E0K6_9GAMM|nr:hypothetical protein [Sinobacterium caligoides]ROS05651.1 hypothetical protein EDC56_1197 [Sinobacterium caligoides]